MNLTECPYLQLDSHGFPFVADADEAAYLQWVEDHDDRSEKAFHDDYDDEEARMLEELRTAGTCPF